MESPRNTARKDKFKIKMDKKQIARILLVVGIVLIIGPMLLNRSGEELSGLLRSATILGAGCEILAGVFYVKSKKDDED